jgi:hypothetical protein
MFATVPEIPVSDETLAWIHQGQAVSLSQRFVGMRFTHTDGTWYGKRGSCFHEAEDAGTLHVKINDCPHCLEHEWPGWSIRRTEDGYEGTDGERVVCGRSRTQFVCRLAATTTWGRHE